MKFSFLTSLRSFCFIVFIFLFSTASAQKTGIVRGSVKDKNTQEAIIGAVVSIEGGTIAATTDTEGNYRLQLPVGTYNIKASYLGYTTLIKFNIPLSTGNAQAVNFEMEEQVSELSEVDVTFEKGKSAVATDMVTPLSVQALTTEEIKSNPGGSFDVSRVIQTLPGVGGSGGGAARNDIIVRGGAPMKMFIF